MTELEVLNRAKQAAEAEALRIWERDGKIDCGSCGNAVMLLDKRSKLTKAAIAGGFAWSNGGDVFVKGFVPDCVKSQNADISQGAARAFRQVLIDAGYEKSIKKFWTYID